MLDQLQLSDFEHLVNQSFAIRFHHPEAELPALLLSAEPLKAHPGSPRPPFALTFRTAQRGQYYQQAVYTLVHPEKGELELFFVPLGPDAEGMKYEVIFN
jgi:hypothetical protein